MQVQDMPQTSRVSVPASLSGNGDQTEGPRPGSVKSPGEAEDAAARRRFEALVAVHLPAMRACASRLCRSHHDPDDVVQDALLRGFLAFGKVRDPARMRSWLLTIVNNTFIDLTRKRRRRPEQVQLLLEELPAPGPIDPAPWDQIEPDAVRAAVEQLPDDVRDTYRMFADEGLDYAAIAEAQQILKSTVGTRIHRARRRLCALLTAGPAERGPQGRVPP